MRERTDTMSGSGSGVVPEPHHQDPVVGSRGSITGYEGGL